MGGGMNEPKTDDDTFRCWCGAVGRFSEMFDFSDSEFGCNGSGIINCECGGDFCVCHNHGEYECPGCEYCEDNEDEIYEW